MRKNPIDQRILSATALLHLRSGRATSRTRLARLLGISPSTVGLYVDHLIATGYVDESGLEQGAKGRPQRTLATLPQAGWFAGVEFNADRVQAVKVDFSGKLVASQMKSLPGDADTRTVMEVIKKTVAALASLSQGPMLAVGIGTPGLVDPQNGLGLHYAFIPDWQNVPIARTLGEHFQAPVTLENNLRAIAVGERWFGGGRDLDNYVILGPRSGFGIAMVQGGQLIGGAHHAAGEIGRWPWPIMDGGTDQELHDALSAPALWRRLTNVPAGSAVPEDLQAALAQVANVTGPSWDEVINDYARVIGCLQLLLDTEVFFLHGPLTALGTRFCNAISETALSIAPGLAGAPLKIVPSALGDDAGALGAASLAMEAWIPAV